MGTGHTLFLVESESVNSISRMEMSHKAFNEAWVRDLVFRTPQLLPVEDVLSDGGTFVPIGIEIALGTAGRVDVLGVTTGGYPVVVETKLWRNPQARREVLAQTIDYIKAIARFDYSSFEALWRERTGPSSPTLFKAAAAVSATELDEAEFIDRVGRACARGDILGFIVGDGIQQGLAELVDHLSRDSAHLRYSIALLELRCFQIPGGGLAVLPNIVREVLPVERAYIKIDTAPGLTDHLAITSVSKPVVVGPPPEARTPLTEDEFWTGFERATGGETKRKVRSFVEDLTHSGEDHKLLETEYKQRALMLKVVDPVEAKPGASVFAITTDGTAYNSSHGFRQACKWGIPSERVTQILDEYYRRLHAISPGFRVEGIVHLASSQFVPISEWVGHLEDISNAIKSVALQLRSEQAEE